MISSGGQRWSLSIQRWSFIHLEIGLELRAFGKNSETEGTRRYGDYEMEYSFKKKRENWIF